MEKARAIATMLVAATAFAGTPAMAQQGTESKGATANTERANAAVRQAMTMNDKQDFEDATRGLMAQLNDPIVKAADGRVVWNTQRYEFVKGDPPPTVNPSLWREQKLNTAAGLFKVVDGVYQIRGYDMANMTLVEGASGWIVIDTLFTEDVARAGLKLAMETLKSSKPVVAVIYTHSHADHFGGVRGVVDEADVRSGKVKLIAPDGFMDNAIAENVLAGNAMSRRANYMYGISLPANDKGSVGTGLGMTLSNGVPGLIPPTSIVTKTGEEMTIDGVRIQFQMAQDTEAPSEMMMYLPEKKALCLSEVAVKLMHNVYTIRGAKVRDALVWSKYINETLDLFPDAEVAFASHHWPTWGNANVRQFVANQRDTYRFLHDRALNLA
ncbi:MAG: MBL fold metallo-hydrolase, partial [Pseudolabrys sp.]